MGRARKALHQARSTARETDQGRARRTSHASALQTAAPRALPHLPDFREDSKSDTAKRKGLVAFEDADNSVDGVDNDKAHMRFAGEQKSAGQPRKHGKRRSPRRMCRVHIAHVQQENLCGRKTRRLRR